MRSLLALSTVLAAAPLAAASPIAEVICAPTGKMTQKRERQFGERLHSWGTRGPEQVMQARAGDHADWTPVASCASGTSCIVAMGAN